MAPLRALAALALASAATGLQVRDDPVMHNLTICNAYADRKPLSVYTISNKAKLTEEPLEYKSCKMVTLELAEGERVDFKLGGLSVGTFHASGLPFTAASLLLVPYHRDGTMSATFASHSFSLSEQAQVAVVDAYTGEATGAMRIQEGAKRAAESAELKPGSSVSMAAGSYLVSLDDAAGTGRRLGERTLHAADSGKYVVMQVGSEAEGYAQELVVFPVTGSAEGARAGSGALRAAFPATAAAACLAALLAAW